MEAASHARIETVRGAIPDQLAEAIIGFWSDHGALSEEEGKRRLAEVVSVALGGDGEIVGVSSVYPSEIPLIGGRRFWVYRSFAAPEASVDGDAMINAAFAALEPEYGGKGEDPVGLCVPVGDPEEMKRRPEAFWPETEMLFAGYTKDGMQARIRYFEDALIGPGLPNSQTVAETRRIDYSLGDNYRAEPFETSSVTPEDVLALWRREGAVPEAEAQRRVHEVLNVVVERDQGVIALSTAYLQRSAQLGMDLWYFRTFVAAAHRSTHVGTQLTFQNRDLLEGRYLRGEDTRASGIIFELEHEGMKTYYNRAVWEPAMFYFIGDNVRGDHVRVHYFPGVKVPMPGGGG